MKKVTFFLILFLGILSISAPYTFAQKNSKNPAITFEQKTHNFGDIPEDGGKVSCEFKFTNTGASPLVIVSAIAGCGCTKPTYDDAPIEPGKSSVIKVTFNPSGRPGEFTKNITVRTNDPNNKKINLKISGVVIPKKK